MYQNYTYYRFPTETQEEFESVIDFMKEVKFDRLGVFTYSPEEGTPACRMDGQIDEEIKAQRKSLLWKLRWRFLPNWDEVCKAKLLKLSLKVKLRMRTIYTVAEVSEIATK